MDRTRFPLLSRYADALPDGLASYPFAQAKGSVHRTMILTAPIRLADEDLPPELAAIVADPPLPSAWASEVLVNGLSLAVQDRISKEQYEAWVYQRNRRIITNPLYKILFWMISPERVFVGLSHRTAAFRRGTDITLLERTSTSALIRLGYPPHLHDEITLYNVTTAYQVVAEAAGAVSAVAKIVRFDATSAEILTTWK